MKKIIASFLFLGLTTGLFSQDDSPVQAVPLFGGFGGPFWEASQLNGDPAMTIGGGGGVIFDGSFVGAYGQFTITDRNFIAGSEKYNLAIGHGGFWLGYAWKSHRFIHPYISFKNGWGTASLVTDNAKESNTETTDAIYVMQPELGVEINVFPFMRVLFTGGYRRVSGLKDSFFILTNEELSNFTSGVTFRFGGFN